MFSRNSCGYPVTATMLDVTLVWDCDLLFEKLFVEHGLSYQRVPSSALAMRFLPASRVLIVPTGFANQQYTKVTSGIEANKGFFDRFVRKGGVLVVYGALVPEYTYQWLPFTIKYKEQYGAVDIKVVQEHGCTCVFDGDRAECDGYFTETDGDIILTGDGLPIMVAKDHGDGMIIATTIHEFPSGAFLKWAVTHR